MEDGEGRHIDFRNTVILLTSNIGGDLICGLCRDPQLLPDVHGLNQALRKPLLETFPAALLGRLSVVPYLPLGDDVMRNIVRLQLDRVGRRIGEHHGVGFHYDDQAVALIVSRCTEVESGGRMIDAILTDTVLPAISREILLRTLDAAPLHDVHLSAAGGTFTYAFEQAPTCIGECHA